MLLKCMFAFLAEQCPPGCLADEWCWVDGYDQIGGEIHMGDIFCILQGEHHA